MKIYNIPVTQVSNFPKITEGNSKKKLGISSIKMILVVWDFLWKKSSI